MTSTGLRFQLRFNAWPAAKAVVQAAKKEVGFSAEFGRHVRGGGGVLDCASFGGQADPIRLTCSIMQISEIALNCLPAHRVSVRAIGNRMKFRLADRSTALIL